MRLRNLLAEPIHVRHADLERSDEQTHYRSNCPVCKRGILLLKRDEETLVLLAEDRCVTCGQQFVYDDIDDLRKRESNT